MQIRDIIMLSFTNITINNSFVLFSLTVDDDAEDKRLVFMILDCLFIYLFIY